jgi:uracil-DNA glycosylase
VDEMKKLQAIVALGRIAHESIVRALGGKLSDVAFGHGSRHQLGPIALFCSYHCSRYNTNTRVLTPEMFRRVFATVRRYLDA